MVIKETHSDAVRPIRSKLLLNYSTVLFGVFYLIAIRGTSMFHTHIQILQSGTWKCVLIILCVNVVSCHFAYFLDRFVNNQSVFDVHCQCVCACV